MITTVTISTISAVTTVAAMGLTAAISIAAVVSLIFFLTIQELANTSGTSTHLRLARFFSVGILPLALSFVVILVVKIAESIT